MKILKPDVTSWLCPEDWHTLVARAARVCYGVRLESAQLKICAAS